GGFPRGNALRAVHRHAHGPRRPPCGLTARGGTGRQRNGAGFLGPSTLALVPHLWRARGGWQRLYQLYWARLVFAALVCAQTRSGRWHRVLRRRPRVHPAVALVATPHWSDRMAAHVPGVGRV